MSPKMIKVERNKETGKYTLEAHGPKIQILSEIRVLVYLLIARHGFMASEILQMFVGGITINEIEKEKGAEETDNE